MLARHNIEEGLLKMRRCKQCGNPLYDDDRGYDEHGKQPFFLPGDFCSIGCVNAYRRENLEIAEKEEPDYYSDDEVDEVDDDSGGEFYELDVDDDDDASSDNEEVVADAPAPKYRFTGARTSNRRINTVPASGRKVPTRVAKVGAEKQARIGWRIVLAACIAIAASLLFLSSKILIVAIIIAAGFAALIGILLIRGV